MLTLPRCQACEENLTLLRDEIKVTIGEEIHRVGERIPQYLAGRLLHEVRNVDILLYD